MMNSSSNRWFLLLSALLLGACAGQQAEEDDQPLQLTSQTPQPVAETPAEVNDAAGFIASLPVDPYTQQVFPQLSSEYKQAYKAALKLLKEPEQQQAAEAALIALTQREEQAAAPWLQLARIQKQKTEFDKALKSADKAIELSPYKYSAYTLKGIIYRELGEFEKAEASYQAILERWQGYAPAHRNLGILYDLYMGRQQQAVEHYEKYLLLVEEDRQVAIWLADLKRRLPEKVEEQQAEPAVSKTESAVGESP